MTDTIAPIQTTERIHASKLSVLTQRIIYFTMVTIGFLMIAAGALMDGLFYFQYITLSPQNIPGYVSLCGLVCLLCAKLAFAGATHRSEALLEYIPRDKYLAFVERKWTKLYLLAGEDQSTASERAASLRKQIRNDDPLMLALTQIRTDIKTKKEFYVILQ